MMVRQNKWRATRYGLDAQLVDSFTFELCPARTVASNLVESLRGAAEQLNCRDYLARVLDLASGPTWAERQLQIFRETGDPVEVVRRLSQASRLSGAAN
jgi:carboxylate-amine ligase